MYEGVHVNRKAPSIKPNACSVRHMPSDEIKRAAVIWIRDDIRLSDHAPWLAASSVPQPSFVLPVYCLSPALLHPRCDNPQLSTLPTLGPHRCRWDLLVTCRTVSMSMLSQWILYKCTCDAGLRRRFVLQALRSLQQQLLARGSDLQFAVSTPEQEIPALVQCLAEQVSHVDLYHYLQIGRQSVVEEDAVADAFHKACKESGLSSEVHQFWGHTLYHPQDALAAFRTPATKGRPSAGSSTDQIVDERLNDCQALFENVPRVMTSFRKVNKPLGTLKRH